MARKKVVFVIVEGPSDQDALELLLTKIFDNNRLFVCVTYGDITTNTGNNPSNILRKVTDVVKFFADNYHLQQVNFYQVIHIIDTDGAYTDDKNIIENANIYKTEYTPNIITTSNRQNIIDRNSMKRKNLNKLSETSYIWGIIPYSVYYMSCNLDHVLYDKPNSTDDEKEINSHKFASKYKSDIDGFKDFISNSPFSVNGDYPSSWRYIKEANHSLERHTNLGLCFPDD